MLTLCCWELIKRLCGLTEIFFPHTSVLHEYACKALQYKFAFHNGWTFQINNWSFKTPAPLQEPKRSFQNWMKQNLIWHPWEQRESWTVCDWNGSKELSSTNVSLHRAAKSSQNTSFIAVAPYVGMTKSLLDAFSYLYDIDETSGFSDCKSETAICSVLLLSECLLAVLWFCLTHILAVTGVKRSLLLQVARKIVPMADVEYS